MKGIDKRPVTLRILSIYVHDDADFGVWGCGDFEDVVIHYNGVNWAMVADNGTGWTDDDDQDYCSDHNYLMPQDLALAVNRYQNSAKVGAMLHIKERCKKSTPSRTARRGWGRSM